jgi:predicted Ser/Thr protein kinase
MYVITSPDFKPAAELETQTQESSLLFQELAEALAPHLLLVRLLGQGGMGLVYLARDPALKRLVAVKVLSPALARDDTARLRFAREAETMAAMSHPNIVSVYQVGELPRSGTDYFVMQYISGKALSDVFPLGTPTAEGKVRRCLGEIAYALAAAHRMGVVHRDIKPANVMLDQESGRYLVLDFGISAILAGSNVTGGPGLALTSGNVRIGTPRYMSPEQASGLEVTGKSDVYSLGCLAYELLTGEPPFKSTTSMEMLASHVLKPPPKVSTRRPELDPQFAALVDRCLSKRPEERPSAEDLTRALLPALKSLIEWPPPGLEPLRGFGAKWTRTAGVVAGTGTLFFLELMIQPTVSRPCCWNLPEFSLLWDALKRLSYITPIHLDDPDAMSVWYFMLDATFIVLLLQLPLFLMHSWQLASRLRQGARAGYPLGTLFDLGWDDRSDTSDLLNGTGHQSLLSETDRTSILRMRRVRSILLVTAILLTLTAPTVWLYIGAYVPWPDNAPVLGLLDVVALWSLPGLALLGALAATAVLWRRMPGPSRREHNVSRSPSVSYISRDLVSVWLTSAGHEPVAALPLVPLRLLPLITPVLALALTFSASTVLTVVFKSTARMTTGAKEARSWIRQTSSASSTAGALEPSVLAVLALVATPTEIPGDHVPGIDSPADRRIGNTPLVSVAYCLNSRAVLFGGSTRTSEVGPSRRGFTDFRLSRWRGHALEAAGLGGLIGRSANCNAVLGAEVSTVDDSQ